MVTEAMKLKDACTLEEKLTNLDSSLKIGNITLPKKVHLVKAIREGNGTPFQYSCLENPMDGGAW